MKKKLIILTMILLTMAVMYFPASAKTSNEGNRPSVAENLKVNVTPQRYVRYRGRIYRIRYRRYRRVRRVRYYRRYRRYRRY